MYLLTLDKRLVNLAHFAMVTREGFRGPTGKDAFTLYALAGTEDLDNHRVTLFTGAENDCVTIVNHLARAARSNLGAVSLADIPLSCHTEKGQSNDGES